jgi:hypothetical protein
MKEKENEDTFRKEKAREKQGKRDQKEKAECRTESEQWPHNLHSQYKGLVLRRPVPSRLSWLQHTLPLVYSHYTRTCRSVDAAATRILPRVLGPSLQQCDTGHTNKLRGLSPRAN